MPIAPEPSTSRGEVTLQPSYFTSSLYVDPLRGDLTNLVVLYATQCNQSTQPFELFKKLWTEQGWCWLHMRTFDGRGRQAFLRITKRLFIERLSDKHAPLERVVALFALYTFHNTQPTTSVPPIYSESNVDIPIDIYQAMVSLPSQLKDDPLLARLRPYVVFILSTLLDAQVFYVLPRSSLRAQNPSALPREIFVPDGQDPLAAFQAARPNDQADTRPTPKKKGRPSRRDKARKAKEALASLDRYLDKNTVYLVHDEAPCLPSASDSTMTADGPPLESKHVVFGQAPHTSLSNYLSRKQDLVGAVYAARDSKSDARGVHALEHANDAVLDRLKQIDAMAAEKGLEVGGEGGEQTGLARIARAVDELRQCTGSGANGGILALLEGAGMETSDACRHE